MKAIFIFYLLISSLALTYAQWYQHFPYPTNDDLYDIQFVSDDIGWISGEWTLWKTTDGGFSWFQQDENNCFTRTFFFADSLHGWYRRKLWDPIWEDWIYKSTDGGDNWEIQSKFNSITSRNIFFIDSLIGWMTNGTDILYTTNGGFSWQKPQMNCYVQTINNIFFYNYKLGWAATGSGAIINSTDGGLSWNLQTSFTNTNLGLIKFSDENNGFAIGSLRSTDDFSSKSIFLKTTNSGVIWELYQLDSSNYMCSLASLAVFDLQNFLVIGNITDLNGIGHIYLYKSSDSGLNWVRTEVQDDYNGLFTKTNQTVFMVGGTGQIKMSTNQGETWEWISRHLNLATDYRYLSVYFLNDNEGWITGNNGSILHTTNSGETWSSQSTVLNAEISEIMFANEDLGWAVGNNLILKTTDKGENWIQINPDFEIYICQDVFSLDQYCWIVDFRIIRSTDGGDSWEVVYLKYDSSINSVWFVSNTIGWAVGTEGNIMKTEDCGDSWIPQNSEVTEDLKKVFFIDENIGWVYGEYGDYYRFLLKTTNGGNDWETIWETSINQFQIHSIFFTDAQCGWMAGTGNVLLKTTNGGNVWNQDLSYYCLNNNLCTIYFTSSKTGWLVGVKGLVLSTKKPITNVEVSPERGITNYSLSQNYPNPFNPITILQYTISTTQHVTLKIYDILGREIKTIVNEEKPAGEYEIEFDASYLSSGIYFYRLKAGNFIETKKMVLLR